MIEEENHKGQICQYSGMVCKTGLCSECNVYRAHRAMQIRSERLDFGDKFSKPAE